MDSDQSCRGGWRTDSDQSTTKILFPLLYSVEVGEERTVTSPPHKYCFCYFIL